MAKDLDDLRALARAFRTNGQGILAHTIEAGLDEALKTVAADGDTLVPMNKAELELIQSMELLGNLPEGRSLLAKVKAGLSELDAPHP